MKLKLKQVHSQTETIKQIENYNIKYIIIIHKRERERQQKQQNDATLADDVPVDSYHTTC